MGFSLSVPGPRCSQPLPLVHLVCRGARLPTAMLVRHCPSPHNRHQPPWAGRGWSWQSPPEARPSSGSLSGQVGWASPDSTWLFSPHCLHSFCSCLCSHITGAHPTPHIICIHPISPPHMTLHSPQSHPHIPYACPAPIPTPPMAPSLPPVSLAPSSLPIRAAGAQPQQPRPAQPSASLAVLSAPHLLHSALSQACPPCFAAALNSPAQPAVAALTSSDALPGHLMGSRTAEASQTRQVRWGGAHGVQHGSVWGTQLGQAAPQGRIRTKCSRFSHTFRPTLQAWMGMPTLTSGSPGPDSMGKSAPLPGKGSPSPIFPEHGDLGEGWLPRAGSLHTGYIGHKPRQSSAFNYHGREVAQQSEKIESGSPETARSGQQTAQLRDIARHLPAEASTAQSPPMPLCPSQTLPRQTVPQPARLDQHWGKTELLGSLGRPLRAGVHPGAHWAQLKGGTCLHTTSIPQGSHPKTTQPAPLQGKPRCLGCQSPPGSP